MIFIKYSNPNNKAGRFLMSVTGSLAGFVLLLIFIGIKSYPATGPFFSITIPMLAIMHFPFWLLLNFACGELLFKHRKSAFVKHFTGLKTIFITMFLLCISFMLPFEKSVLFGIAEALCWLLSLLLTERMYRL